jgi:NAD-dependent SIR2 family protein deacetylase
MTCKRCGNTLDASDFAIDRSRKNGHKSVCKRCDAERARDYYTQHRDEVLDRIAVRQGRTRDGDEPEWQRRYRPRRERAAR